MPTDSDVSGLLRRASAGDREALDALVPLVYEDLRILAHQRLAGERSDHTLNTTGLVHESFLRLAELHKLEWKDRAHFFSLASRMMRRVLVDYARRQGAAKRGGGWVKMEFQEDLPVSQPRATVIEELDVALTRLEAISPRQSRLLEQRYFGGLKLEECAEALGVSLPTVVRELRSARAWLALQLDPEPG